MKMSLSFIIKIMHVHLNIKHKNIKKNIKMISNPITRQKSWLK